MNGQGRPILVRAPGLPRIPGAAQPRRPASFTVQRECSSTHPETAHRWLSWFVPTCCLALLSLLSPHAVGQPLRSEASRQETPQLDEPSEAIPRPAAENTSVGEQIDLRLRLDWGAVEPLLWNGSIELSEGRIGDLRSLGIGADVPGNKWFTARNRVAFRSLKASTYDGLDLSILANEGATLTIRLACRKFPDHVKQLTVPVADLVNQSRTERLFPENATPEVDFPEASVVVRRAPGDQLRLQFPAAPMIFSCSEQVNWQVLPSRTGLPENETYRCLVSVRESSSGEVVDEYETTVRTGPYGLIERVETKPLAVPDTEGIYRLQVSLQRKVGLTAPFRRRSQEVTTERQFVALADVLETPVSASWMESIRLEPADLNNNDSWLSLPAVPGIPNLQGERPLHHGTVALQRVGGRPFTRIATGGWVAYPLRIAAPGKPYIIEAAYSANQPQTFSLGLMEKDASGQTARLSMETGVDVNEPAMGDEIAIRYHRWVVWPSTKTPWLVVSNRRPDQPASVGTIRVLAGGSQLGTESSQRRGIAKGERRIAAFFDAPSFHSAYNARKQMEPGAQFPFHDWQTYYSACRRMIDHLKYGGYNTLVVNVYRDGGSLYPSGLLEPTPQWDTGRFFSSGQDPYHKDVVELLFRLCDREGIRVVPSFQFSGTIPELEMAQRLGKDVRLMGDKVPSERYNALNPVVQTAIRRVLHEFEDRYGWHESFDGIALQLAPNSLLPLPGFAAPLDDQTLDLFQQETQIQVPRDQQLSVRGRFLHADPRRRQVWLNWRAGKVASFVELLAEDLRRTRGDATFMLLGHELMKTPVVRYYTTGRENRIEAAMLTLGLDAERLSQAGDVSLLKPHVVHPELRISGNAADFEAAVSPDFDSYFSGDEFQRSVPSRAGVSFLHPLQTGRLPQLDEANPLGTAKSDILLATCIAASGKESRRRFIQSLAFSDMRTIVDGGAQIPNGQEESSRGLFRAFRSLPDKPFRAVTPQENDATQPIVVRQMVDGDSTYFYLVNEAPWAVEVRLTFSQCDPENFHVLGQRTLPQPQSGEGTAGNWMITADPYDLIVARYDGPGFQIEQWRVTLPERVISHLTQQLRDLNARAEYAKRERSWIQNPDFEQQGSGDAIPGWNSHRAAGLSVGLASPGRTGRFGLKLSRGEMAEDLWVDSTPFPPPSTGSLYISAWLRVDDESRQPPLRVAIFDDQDFYRMLPVGAGAGAKPVRETWTQFLFEFRDIPVGRLGELHVGFDLMGIGDVYIDDIQMFDLLLSADQRNALKLDSSRLSGQLAAPRYDVADCQRFLNGYWPKYLQRHLRDETPVDRVANNEDEAKQPPRTEKESKNPLKRVRDALPSFKLRRE